MKIKQWLGCITILLLTAYPAWAEFYRYVDEHGNVIFTDDLGKVPVQQRSQIQIYEGSRTAPQPEAAETEKVIDNQEKSDSDIQEGQRLKEQQTGLNQEYDALMAERAKLNEQKDQVVTPDQKAEYNKKIVDFNTRIQAYEEKRDALAREIEAFNNRVSAKEQKKSEDKQ